MKDAEKVIQRILDRFDFHKVLSVMKFVNWTYHDGPPDIDRLIASGKEMLATAVSSDGWTSISSGGLVATYNPKTEEGEELKLKFVLESRTWCSGWVP